MNNNSYNYKEKKIVTILSSNLEIGIAMNVVGHLAISIGAYAEKDIMGRSTLIDASGIVHLGISKYPFIITKVKPNRLRQAIEEARLNKNILVADYPKQMLETGHDDELNEAIEQAQENSMEYLGAIMYGTTEEINKITGRFSLWK